LAGFLFPGFGLECLFPAEGFLDAPRPTTDFLKKPEENLRASWVGGNFFSNLLSLLIVWKSRLKEVYFTKVIENNL
jgi:hypothetical protein